MHARFALLSALLALPSTAIAQTGLTIYQDGRVLVRRTLPLQVPAGASRHRLVLGDLDPATLFPLDTALRITRARYDAAVDEANTMRRAVGTSLKFIRGFGRGADTVTAFVMGVNPERFRLEDGTVTFSRPGVPLYGEQLVQVDATTEIDLVAPGRRDALALGYFTEGASWQASYQVVLGVNGRAYITGQAVLPSTGFSADSAEVQVVAGAIRRVAATPATGGLLRDNRVRALNSIAEEASAVSEAVGEAYVYTLPGRVTLRPGVTTTAALFDPASAGVEKSFTVRGGVPWQGFLQQNGEENRVPVEVMWTVNRPARSAFGGRPLPGGVARLFEQDLQGRPQLVGEAAFGHTAAGQPLRLTAAHAFDLTARRIQTAYRTQRDSIRTHAFANYRVTIANAKDSAVTVDVLERRSGDWQILSSSIAPERLSATEVRFRVRVPAGGEAEVTYQVRVTW